MTQVAAEDTAPSTVASTIEAPQPNNPTTSEHTSHAQKPVPDSSTVATSSASPAASTPTSVHVSKDAERSTPAVAPSDVPASSPTTPATPATPPATAPAVASQPHPNGAPSTPMQEAAQSTDGNHDRSEATPATTTVTVSPSSQNAQNVVPTEVPATSKPSAPAETLANQEPAKSDPSPTQSSPTNTPTINSTSALNPAEDSSTVADEERKPNQVRERQGSGDASESPSKSNAQRPPPKRLPKVAKNRPENARVFIGNLASEYTSADEIVSIFHKYGSLIEEPVLRRSFGFVQYSSAEAAREAVKGEQGRIIGGIGIDLSIADNREVKKGTHIQNNTPFQHSRPFVAQNQRGRVRERENPGQGPGGARKKRRSVSPTSAARKGGVHPPQFRRFRPDPKNGVYLRILCMSPTAKGYAKHCENTFRTMTGLKADILHIVAAGLGEALGRAMRDTIPYVMVVASKDVEDGTCTIRTLEKTGYEKSGRGNGVIPLREAVEVCLIERGVIMPTSMAQHSGPHPGSLGRGPGMGGAMPFNPRGQQPQGGAQWLNQGQNVQPATDNAKPGWMTGPRAPHPANQASQRTPPNMPPAPISVVGNGASGAPGGYGYTPESRPSYGNSVPPPPPHAQARPEEYGRTGSQAHYDAQATGPGQNFPSEYSRGGPHGQYPPQQMNPSTGYTDKYGGPQIGRGSSYSEPGGRESEYDPTTVMPSRRPQQGSGYQSWNRDQPAQGGGMYNGSSRGQDVERQPNYPPSSQAPYQNQMYGNSQTYSDRQGLAYVGDRPSQPNQYAEQAAPAFEGRNNGYGHYDTYEGGASYRRDTSGNPPAPVNAQDVRYGGEGYNSAGGGYQAGGPYPHQDGRGGWDEQQSAGAPPGPRSNPHGMQSLGMGYGTQTEPPHTQGSGYVSEMRGGDSQYDSGRAHGGPPNQYDGGRHQAGQSQYDNGRGSSSADVRDPRGNQRYSGRGGGDLRAKQYDTRGNPIDSGQQPSASAQAAVSRAGTVDIGKLTNLISAFQQKQQQTSHASRPQQHPQPQPRPPQQNQRPGPGGQADHQGVSQFLQMPGVQQALQNIGGTQLSGYQNMYQQGMGMGTMSQNRGRPQGQGGQGGQGYYG